MAGSKIDNGQIYTQLEKMRLETKSDLLRLESKVDSLETGRITKLEEEVTNLRVSIATAATKLAILGFISSSIVGAVISVVVPRLIK